MILCRNKKVSRHYIDGKINSIKVFDPFFRWMYQDGMGEISIRGEYAIGFMWKWNIGTFSRRHERWIKIGHLTLYVHLGEAEPHNPRTGEYF